MALDTGLDMLDRQLLNLMQSAFPLVAEPFAALAAAAGMSAEQVVERVRELHERKLVRIISPVIDARRLGYQTTLVAMKVRKDLETAERVITAHPGVSHGYERDHEFNVWFTLATPPGVDPDKEVERIGKLTGPEIAFALPATKLFKLEVYFDMTGEGRQPGKSAATATLHQAVILNKTQRAVVNAIQDNLPLVFNPFQAMAVRAGMDVPSFLAAAQELMQMGVIRRYGASLDHHKAGFNANAMTCWVVPAEQVDTAGRALAALPEVSHCYERRTNPYWQHNVFAMIHGHSIEGCQTIAERVSGELGLAEPTLLFSTREFKKSRIRYAV